MSDQFDELDVTRRIAQGRGRQLDRAVEQIAALEAERDRLRAALDTAQTTVTFFASVIKCGEPWTDACEEALRAALDAEEGT